MLSQALRLTEIASPASLTAAAGALASKEVAGLPNTEELASLGDALFKQLYPELNDPFPPGTPPLTNGGADASDFFVKIVPALALIFPTGPLDAARAADLKAGLAAADGLNKDSALPPYLQGLLLKEREEPGRLPRASTSKSASAARLPSIRQPAKSSIP